MSKVNEMKDITRLFTENGNGQVIDNPNLSLDESQVTVISDGNSLIFNQTSTTPTSEIRRIVTQNRLENMNPQDKAAVISIANINVNDNDNVNLNRYPGSEAEDNEVGRETLTFVSENKSGEVRQVDNKESDEMGLSCEEEVIVLANIEDIEVKPVTDCIQISIIDIDINVDNSIQNVEEKEMMDDEEKKDSDYERDKEEAEVEVDTTSYASISPPTLSVATNNSNNNGTYDYGWYRVNVRMTGPKTLFGMVAISRFLWLEDISSLSST